jgi:hypothetical protein
MTDVINCYPETLHKFNFNNKLIFNKQKKWKPSIDFKFLLKSNIYDLVNMYKHMKDKCYLDRYVKFPIEKITIPQKLIDIIKKNTSSTNITFDFIPCTFAFNLQKNEINDLFQMMFHKIIKNYGINLDEKYLLLKKIVFNELAYFFPNFMEKNQSLKQMEQMEQIVQMVDSISPIIINSKDNKGFILIFDFVIMVMTDNYILIIPNEDGAEDHYMLIVNGKTCLRTNNLLMVDIIKKEFVSNDVVYRNYGYIKTNNQKKIFDYSIDSNLDINEIYDYSNKETKLEIKLFGKTFTKKNIHISKYTKNECEFEEYYDYNNDFRHIISQCMINDNNTGLRYRGKFTGTSYGDKNISRIITFDDKIVYNKEGDETITNLLVDKKKYLNRTEMIIGWKVAKSIEGEKRIIKLGIIPDAKIVRPIDEEYFITYNKERCDKAIVMDIQLPIADTEISVIPNEMVAYSYVYKSDITNFDYKVGQEVIPDSFNSDENIGCAQGIHYFQNRMDLFKAYID